MNIEQKLKNVKILVTGGAGFIGSNLCEYLLKIGSIVTCLDNFSTGYMHNISSFIDNPNFTLINGDIRDLEICIKACRGQEYVLHQAALGSVPRSLEDPITSNEVNVSGFLNMLVACKESNIRRFVFAASSSTYGDSSKLPKLEHEIGKPLSPYAITKYINELYADIFHKSYSLDYIGLRYFNVFGRRQDPNGAYAAVIPLFVKKLINYESPIINGDGSFSRDFTYIDNVIRMNILSLTCKNKNALNQIYNTACGERTTLLDLVRLLKNNLAEFDQKISTINYINGPARKGDIPHSLASIEKAEKLLNYVPSNNFKSGIKHAINWYWNNLR